MLIRSCFSCKFHKIKQGENDKNSYCGKENCWSRYSKCVAIKALDRFLEQESSRPALSFSALDRFYSLE